MRIVPSLSTMFAFLAATALAAHPPCGTFPGPEPAGSEPALFAPGWLEPEVLPEQVNAAGTQFNAFVDPAERYLIVSLAGHAENLGQVDYWIVFRNADDTWRGPVNLGPRVKGAGREGWSPYVSPDGRWFFFMSAATTGPVEPLAVEGLRAIHEAPGNGLGHVWILDSAFLDELGGRP